MTKKNELLKQINETKDRIAALRETQEKARLFGLATLMESSLDKTTLVVSIKAMSDELQTIAQKLAKMQADEIMPIIDPLKEAFGPELAEAFNSAATESLRNLVEAVTSAKDAIYNEVMRLEAAANGEPTNDMAMNPPADDAGLGDIDSNIGAGDDAGIDDLAADGAEMGPGDDMAAGDDLGGMGDDLGGDTMDEPAVGRARKESAEFRKASNPDKFVFEAVVARVREGTSGPEAARLVAENLGLDLSDVVEIVAERRLKK